MKKRKTLQELTIKDNFLFGAVMVNEENCKEFLEMVLEIEIDQVKVSKEKSIVYHLEYKGVRLDVYARDEEHTHYNIEMQAEKKPVLGKRSRYYQSQMDMELLMSGEDYTELPNTYVIFLCDFDPFGAGKYRYTFQSVCQETEEASLEDGRKILFLNTRGKNDAEVPGKLVTFLRFVRAGLKESQQDFGDPYVQKLQEFISYVKQSREMAEREGVEIKYYSIIYKAIEDIEASLKGMLKPEYEEVVTSHSEIREIFRSSKFGNIAGVMVQDGEVKRGTKCRILRNGIATVNDLEISSLRRFKDDVNSVKEGYEAGINLGTFNDIEIGDIIETFEMQEIERK